MNNLGDANLARRDSAFIALANAVFACAAKLVEDTRLSVDGLDDAGMGMVYYERQVS
jgi:hypothetical protein